MLPEIYILPPAPPIDLNLITRCLPDPDIYAASRLASMINHADGALKMGVKGPYLPSLIHLSTFDEHCAEIMPHLNDAIAIGMLPHDPVHVFVTQNVNQSYTTFEEWLGISYQKPKKIHFVVHQNLFDEATWAAHTLFFTPHTELHDRIHSILGKKKHSSSIIHRAARCMADPSNMHLLDLKGYEHNSLLRKRGVKCDIKVLPYDTLEHYIQVHKELLTHTAPYVDTQVLDTLPRDIDYLSIQHYCNFIQTFVPNPRGLSELTFEDVSFRTFDHLVLCGMNENFCPESYPFIRADTLWVSYSKEERGMSVGPSPYWFLLQKEEKTQKAPSVVRPTYTPQQPDMHFFTMPCVYYVSDIELLMRDPKRFYYKKCLKASPLEQLDEPFNRIDFGISVHHILNQGLDQKDQIFAPYFEHNPLLERLWRLRFEPIQEWYCTQDHSHLIKKEYAMERSLGRFTLKAIADRIDSYDDEAIIIDYKTGLPPSKAAIENGLKPQLFLEAYILDNVKMVQIWDLYNLKILSVDVHAVERVEQSVLDLIDYYERHPEYFLIE